MLKSMAPNLNVKICFSHNGDYDVKADIGFFQLLLGASCFKFSFTLVCFNFINEAIKTPVKTEEGISV